MPVNPLLYGTRHGTWILVLMTGCMTCLTGGTVDTLTTRCYNYGSLKTTMTSDLWQDVTRLNALYEELMWPVNDRLTMRIEGDHIVIRNLAQEQRGNNV